MGVKSFYAMLAILQMGNPKATARRIALFLEGQKMERRWRDQVASLEKEKPIYKISNY